MDKAKKKEMLSLEEKLEQALVPVDEQPYDVPENWCWVYALNLFDIEYGKGLPTKNLTEEGYPVFGANGQIGFYSEYMYEEEKALMSCRGAYSGTMNQSLPKSYVTSNSLVIEDKGRFMLPKYICYMYEALDTSKLVSGSAQPQVTVQAFDKYPVPLPPLAEQQRIVVQIENLFTKLEGAKEKLDDAINGILLQKEAILKQAYSGELTESWRKENNRSYSEWNIEEVSKKFDVTGGLQKKPDRAPKNNPIPYVTVANVFRNRIDLSEIKYFEVFDGELEKLRLKSKDILIVEGNGSGSEIGRCALWNDELPVCIHQNHIIRMRRKLDNVVPEYVLYYLNSDEGKRIMKERAKTTAGLYNLSTGKIRTISVPFAPYEEQKEIVRVIESLMEKNEQTLECINTVQDKMILLKRAILAKAFRGELGTNNPDEENAIELLKSILA